MFEFIFVATLTTLLAQAEHQIEVEAHSKAVIAAANALMRGIVDATTAAGAYNVTGSDIFNQRSEMALENTRTELARLKILLKDRKAQQENLKRIEKVIAHGMSVVNSLKMPEKEPVSLRSLIGQGSNLRELNIFAGQLGTTLRELVAEEQTIERQSPAAKARNRLMIQMALAGGLTFNVILAIALAVFFMRSTTQRLSILMDNTRRLAKRQDLNIEISGQDEIAELDQSFHKASDELRQLEEFKQQLIGVVSHELKTPLNSMQVSLALLSEGATGVLPEKALKKVQGLESNVVRLIRLIGDLLDIEKLQSGKFELNVREVDLSAVIQSSVHTVKALAEEHRVEIESDCRELKVLADYDRLVQVIVNLLSNAIKYSPENSPVRIETNEDNSLVELRVVDQGRGIPETHLEKIFERFQQVDESDATVSGGTGLGLSICKEIINEHGGSIWVTSTVGQGSTFWIRLPKTGPASQ